MTHRHHFVEDTEKVVTAVYDMKPNVPHPYPLEIQLPLGICAQWGCEVKAVKSPWTGEWIEVERLIEQINGKRSAA